MSSTSSSLWLPAVAAALLAASAAGAQTTEARRNALPPWVVPVLRLVSATHVEPTTGVVLSADGLVLVPHEFARAGGEIVVLDGGTDIIRNGRPARLQRAFPELGLKVLAVDGLKRRAAPVAAAPPADGATVLLAAFPPAEDIAEGAAPLRQVATLILAAGNGPPAISPQSSLPNVTGPLLDGCGNLAGFSIADGVQSMSPSPSTQYRWQAALLTVLAELGLPATGADCSAEPAPPEQEEQTGQPPAEPEQADEEEPPEEVAAPPLPYVEPDAEPAEAPIEEQVTESEPQADVPAPQAELMKPLPTGTASRSWWWLSGALLLAGGFGLYRWRRRGRMQPGSQRSGLPHSGPLAEDVSGASDADADIAGSHRLILRGQYADGRSLLLAATVSDRAVNLEIGRGSADLALDSPAVSRRHARLNGTAQALTLCDLGSSNGSSINGVPCLEGEIMYLEAGDEVILGDVRFTVELEPAAGGPHAA